MTGYTCNDNLTLIQQLMADLPLCFNAGQCDCTALTSQLRSLAAATSVAGLAVYTLTEHEQSSQQMLCLLAGIGYQVPQWLDLSYLQAASGQCLPDDNNGIVFPLVAANAQGALFVLANSSQQQQVSSALESWCRLFHHLLTANSAAAIRDQKAQLAQKSLTAAAAIAWQLDTVNDQLDLDPAGFKLFGLTAADVGALTQQWLFQRMHPEDVQQCRHAFSQYLRGQLPRYDCVGRVWHQAGYWIWIHSRGQLRCYPGGRQKLVGLFFDVTDRMQAQLQLETLTSCVPGVVFQYLRKVNGKRSFPYLSPQAEQLFGVSLALMRQDATGFLQKVHPDDLELLSQQLDQSSKSLEVLQARFRIKSVDGEYLWYLGKARPEQLAYGDVLWHGHLSDISAEIAAEEEMRVAKEQAEQASRFKSSFLANMSHEIRTPMNGVLGMLDVLSAGLTEPQQQTNIRVMQESATALLSVIDDILDFSKLDAGKLAVVHAPCDLSGLIQQIISILDEVALKQQVFLSFFVDPAIPTQVMADGGRIRQVVLNLLSNAIKFSSGLEREGKVHLAVTVIDHDAHDVLLCFSVLDNGIGMSELSLQRLFKPFVQADDSTCRRFGGTGLGLSISQQLVQLMGGLIEVHSQPDCGSEFKVMLPLQVLQTASATSSSSLVQEIVIVSTERHTQTLAWCSYLQAAGFKVYITQEPANLMLSCDSLCVWLIDLSANDAAVQWIDLPSQISSQSARHGVVVLGRGRRRTPRLIAERQVYLDANALSRDALLQAIELVFNPAALAAKQPLQPVLPQPDNKQRILVLEDNSTNQIVIKQMLLQLGYQSDIAGDGVQGLQLAQKNRYDLILTDLHMPLLDGFEFCRAWRDIESLQNLPATPILALTANVMPEERQHCLAAGMNDCLTKPLPIAKLEQRLRQWLRPESPAESTQPTGLETGGDASVDRCFDRELLAKTVGNDAVEEVLADYSDSFHCNMDALKAAMAAGNREQARTAAHRLKSSSHFVGLGCLGQSLHALEQALRERAEDDVVSARWQHCLQNALAVESFMAEQRKKMPQR